MAYTVTQLITRSWYLSGIVARNLETVSGDELNDGLALLNAVLSFKTSDGGLVPYYQYTTFNTVPNQELYFIENLIDVETLTFNLGTIRYSMIDMDRQKYFGSARIDDIYSLPFGYRVERTLDGSNISLYFIPNQVYVMKLMGKYSLTNVTLNQDLETFYDDFYIEYLRYALAEHMCCEYNIEFQPVQMAKLRQYEYRLRETSPADLTMKKQSTFIIQPGINYADVNIGQGWRPN
jgi:hypothetical protein